MAQNRPVTLSQEAVEKLKTVSTATLTTQLINRNFHNTFLTGLAPLRPDLRMIGYALTLRFVPMREDMKDMTYDAHTNVQRIAVESVETDDIMIVDARGEMNAATLGSILATRLKVRGAAGFVTDGGLRDTPGIKEMDLPTYIKVPQAITSFEKHHPLEMNVPIACAGVLIMPGDVLVGDGEGVVAIPSQVAEEVAHATYEQDRLEDFIQEKVASGASIDGVYPPNEQTMAEFDVWRKAKGV